MQKLRERSTEAQIGFWDLFCNLLKKSNFVNYILKKAAMAMVFSFCSRLIIFGAFAAIST